MHITQEQRRAVMLKKVWLYRYNVATRTSDDFSPRKAQQQVRLIIGHLNSLGGMAGVW